MLSVVEIGIAASFMAGLGGGLAAVLALASKRLHVEEDPRIDGVEEMLPHANCGACGTAGCRNFAEQVVAGQMQPAQCTVNTLEHNQAIADYLGVALGEQIKRVARLACAGGTHVAYTRAVYKGLPTCRAAALAGGGGRGCAWGCLGLGDCKTVCGFGAIQMNKFSLPMVDDDKCTACGDCCEVCPKELFSLQPISHQLWISCKNQDAADEAEAHCDLVCTACGRCAADAPEGVITIRNNLAMIDYSKNGLASRLAIERCPTGAIVWLEEQGVVKGMDAKRITRKEPIRMEPLPRD